MTNGGSQGLDVLSKIKSPVKNILFCANGVDLSSLDPVVVEEIRARYYNNSNKRYFISISRLDAHKRIDRGIRIIQKMVKVFNFTDLKFIVIGGGAEYQKLMDLIQSLNLQDYIEFLGPIRHEYVQYHLELAEIFLSMYTSTNVGNPLLEAIRRNKMIVTLNNGDTGEWIEHYVSGLIYDVNDDIDLSDQQYEIIAKDIIHVLKNPGQYDKLKAGIRDIEKRKLWTWNERFAAELSRVNKLLD
jgi:glycosyltransferase involved in cell wall biosynthesis